MNKQINIIEALDWYIWAGVTETSADDLCLLQNTEKQYSEQIATNPLSASSFQNKNVAVPAFSQAATAILKNANDLCLKANSLAELKSFLVNFDGCNLKNTAASTVFGDGNEKAKVMLIGEAPGADEDRLGKPFVGRCGKLLDKMLKAINLNREDCYITNVLPWRPPGNRAPSDNEIAICLPFLKKQIDLIGPDFILLLGGIALKSVMNSDESISRSRGKWLEYVLSNGKKAQVIATYHPSYLLRSSAQKAKVWADLLRLKNKIEETS